MRALLRDGKTAVIDGFTARDGRTYRGVLEIVPEEWTLAVRPAGWNEGEASNAEPEFEVNPEPLGRCPFEEDCSIVESPTQFVCERKLKEAELTREERARLAAEGAPKSCGFVFPRTVCKREITRDEAVRYLAEGKTELLTDFTSRFGRPFSATLVLKENGRHGFEFPPRKPRGGEAAAAGEAGAAPASASAPAHATGGPRSVPPARARSRRPQRPRPSAGAQEGSAPRGPPRPRRRRLARKTVVVRRKKKAPGGEEAPASSGE